ncbi:MAG: hypothetical protein A2514_08645 [Gammaproteobacteria bacterium RIFOXYD12_FULL_61_37]|nr:MAG: hypothetical protein A2514_08645 [Gammaproteobacteria bacterium RIFOXYD12_FULL_61_37]
MKHWRILGLAGLIGLLSLPAGAAETDRAPRLAVPAQGAYTGAYLGAGDAEDQLSFDAMEAFGEMVGKHQALVAFSNFWGEGHFPTRQLKIIQAYGAAPLIYWSPWEPPYYLNMGGRFTLDKILDGQADGYIDDWAREAKAWGRPLLVSWGMEMNGNWFPWSGLFFGAGTPVPGSDPPLYQGPETYKRAYRYVVDRVRQQGAFNVEWVFHGNNGSEPAGPGDAWNDVTQYYPGDDYVDWVGISAYGKQFPQQSWYNFESIFDDAYAKLTKLAPAKPFILAEWGVGEFPDDGDKGAFIAEGFQRMAQSYPRLKAAVYWQERWQNADLSYSNIRVQSSMGSLNAYRNAVASPFWIARPQGLE